MFCFNILLTPKVLKGVSVCVSYFHEDPLGKPGENSERVSLLIDDLSETLGHILTEILSQRKSFHPFGMVVSQGHDVRVAVYCRRERASNIQPKPFPPLFNLREGSATVLKILILLSLKAPYNDNYSGIHSKR